MFTILAFSILANFGSGNFTVDPNATTITNSQTAEKLALNDSDATGKTIGGTFSSGYNWSSVENFGLRLSLGTTNPSSLFYVELYSGVNYDLAGIFSGDTSEITGVLGTKRNVILEYLGGGTGDFSNITALQFTWSGSGESVILDMWDVVDIGPIKPTITFANFVGGNFKLDWEGTGPYPVNVQRIQNLSSGTWTTIATGVTTRTYTDYSTPSGKAFYRLVMP